MGVRRPLVAGKADSGEPGGVGLDRRFRFVCTVVIAYDPLAMDPANRLPSRVSRILAGPICLDVMSSAVCCTVGGFR